MSLTIGSPVWAVFTDDNGLSSVREEYILEISNSGWILTEKTCGYLYHRYHLDYQEAIDEANEDLYRQIREINAERSALRQRMDLLLDMLDHNTQLRGGINDR